MTKHYREFNDMSVVHAGPPDGVDYTLCGLALEGEDGNAPMKRVLDPIRCERCAHIIAFAKQIKVAEIHPDFR